MWSQIGAEAYVIPSSIYVLSADANPGGNSSQCISAFMEGGNPFWLMGENTRTRTRHTLI